MSRPRSAVLPVFCLVALLASAGAARAAHGPPGVILGADDPDVAFELETLSSTSICFIDADGTGSYSAGDSVILTTSGNCSGNSKASDVRLAAFAGQAAGQRLGSGPDSGKPLSAPSTTIAIWFYDGNGDGRMGHGDTTYVNLVNPTVGNVDVGDVRLAAVEGHAAGTVVRGGDPDLTRGLTQLGVPSLAVGTTDFNGNNAFDAGDLLYVNSDVGGNELVEEGDLRLSPIDEARPMGTYVRFGDADGTVFLRSVTRSACSVDLDGSGSYTPADAVFLDLDADCAGSVSVGDIRLSKSAFGPAGSRVAAAASDLALSFLRHGDAELSYVDLDSDGRLDPTDSVYLDLVAVSERRIDAGDVRVSPRAGSAGGMTVVAGDGLIGQTLRSQGLFSSMVAMPDLAGRNAPTQEDPLYLNIDRGSSEPIEPGDIRLVPFGDAPFGGAVLLGTGEAEPRLSTVTAAICATSSSADSYRAGDRVYLSVSASCGNQASVGMVRLVPVGTHASGTVVRAADSDVGSSVVTPAGTIDYESYDGDGNGEWSEGDTLYIDLVSPSSDRVDVGDVRVTAFQAAGALKAVSAGDPDVGISLTTQGSVTGRTVYVDSDNDNAYGTSDIVYVNVDGIGTYVTKGDVRLLPLPETEKVDTEDPGTTTATTTPATTVTTTTTATSTPPQQTLDNTDETDGDDPSPEGADTPAVAALAWVLAAFCLLAMARRGRSGP